jgi:hypothetical protein
LAKCQRLPNPLQQRQPPQRQTIVKVQRQMLPK